MDPPGDLAVLLHALAGLDPSVWIRVMYGHPESISPEMIQALAGHDNLCPYLDIPIQHAAAGVLKRMGRGYREQELLRLFDSIRRAVPDVALRTTVLVGTPSYALYMLETMNRMGIPPASLSLRVGLFGGEPMSDRVRQEIESRLNIIATDNYGVSAIMGPGIAGECELKTGLHINEDNFLVETIDPVTLEVLPEGEEGELVVTTLTKEGLPMVRYRTRDVTSVTCEPCRCGRTTARMMPVKKRTDDMIIVRGVNVYPSEIGALLLDIEHVDPHYQIVVERDNGLDQMILNVELSSGMISDDLGTLVALEDTIKKRVHSVIGLTPKVRLVEPKTLRSVRGSTQVVDTRE